MKKIVFACIGLLFVPIAFVHATVPTVVVPDHCAVIDTDGVSHAYTSAYLGICALEAAKEQGVVSGYALQNFSFGLFLQTLNGVAPAADEYWNLSKNDVESMVGLSDMPLVSGDTLLFRLTSFAGEDRGQSASFAVTLHTAPTIQHASGGGLDLHAPFDSTKALDFLAHMQHEDGSFGSPLLNDWVAVALAAESGGGDMREKLIAYVRTHAPQAESITDNERHAMALQALGISPYDGTERDYVTPIMTAFDGAQIGDPALISDDIFAVFPLIHAGERVDSEPLRNIVAHIIASQKTDGSWEESVDLTAAAVQVLVLARAQEGAQTAIAKALGYLHTKQRPDGGFGNGFSTSWVQQALGATDGTRADWQQGMYTPDYYLATRQERDGGMEAIGADAHTRIWATAYAIPAARRAPWSALLSSFSKPEPVIATTSTPSIAQAATVLDDGAAPHPAPEAAATLTATSQAETVETAPPAELPQPAAQAAAVAQADVSWLNGMLGVISSFFARWF